MTLLPNPVVHHPFAYSFGAVGITGFGLAVLMAFLVGQVVMQRLLTLRGHDAEPVNDMVFAAVVGGLLGAKLYYVVVLGHWDAIFSRGGFVYWGGLFGGMLAVMAVVVKKRAGLMRMFDVAGPSLMAAYAVGRTGCWAVGDDYGRPWNGFLATVFPEGAPPSTAGIMAQEFGVMPPLGASPNALIAVYPTQLYETALAFVMFLVLWRLRNHKHAEGWLFGVYCVFAGAERFVIEFFRAKDDVLPIGITYAQSIALAFIAVGLVWMTVRARVGPGKAGIHAVA